MRPLIGISCGFEHPDPDRKLFKNKRLIYLEQSLVETVYRYGGVPIPVAYTGDVSTLKEMVAPLHGLVLFGGEDICPESYGEVLLDEAWKGDSYRDEYELELIKQFTGAGKAVLGVCRGAQLLNVFYGGTLYQDVSSQKAGVKTHRDQELYDSLKHKVEIKKGTRLREIFGVDSGVVNSVHHQAVKDVGKGLRVGAVSEDGVVEAIEADDAENFVVGVQWHPEWNRTPGLLDPGPLFEKFIECSR